MRALPTYCIICRSIYAVEADLDVEIIHCRKTFCIFLVDECTIGRELHTDAVGYGVFNDFKEVTANHWFATTDVDIEHLQVTQFIKYCFCLFSRQFAIVALTTA